MVQFLPRSVDFPGFIRAIPFLAENLAYKITTRLGLTSNVESCV
jgi:hypothetical protein